MFWRKDSDLRSFNFRICYNVATCNNFDDETCEGKILFFLQSSLELNNIHESWSFSKINFITILYSLIEIPSTFSPSTTWNLQPKFINKSAFQTGNSKSKIPKIIKLLRKYFFIPKAKKYIFAARMYFNLFHSP